MDRQSDFNTDYRRLKSFGASHTSVQSNTFATTSRVAYINGEK